MQFSRHFKDKLNNSWMVICLLLVIIVPIILGFGLFLKSEMLLRENNIWQLLFSKDWRPLSGRFGFYPFIVSSLWITVLALLISGPICILSAIYLTHYAKPSFLKFIHPVVDILAGIPSVIFGVWGILVIVPFIANDIAPVFNRQISGYCLLTGAVVLSVMIIPFILNILIEVFSTVPADLMEASLSLGATKWQSVKYVLLKKAFPGIISALGLGVSRAFGETIAVLMVVGNVTRIPHGVFDPAYPLPALIANNYGEMLSIPMYDSALMLAALILFTVVLLFNFASRLLIVQSEKRF